MDFIWFDSDCAFPSMDMVQRFGSYIETVSYTCLYKIKILLIFLLLNFS